MVKTQRILNMVSGAERAIKLLVAVRSWHLPDFWPERLQSLQPSDVLSPTSTTFSDVNWEAIWWDVCKLSRSKTGKQVWKDETRGASDRLRWCVL
jgi:hypothetical protein